MASDFVEHQEAMRLLCLCILAFQQGNALDVRDDKMLDRKMKNLMPILHDPNIRQSLVERLNNYRAEHESRSPSNYHQDSSSYSSPYERESRNQNPEPRPSSSGNENPYEEFNHDSRNIRIEYRRPEEGEPRQTPSFGSHPDSRQSFGSHLHEPMHGSSIRLGSSSKYASEDGPHGDRLPDFIIIGSKKCGTGAFRTFLSFHSKIVKPR